jgi:hypothetical protein
MKSPRSSRKQGYVTRFGIFLTTVALIIGMIGCSGGGGNGAEYDLTISSTARGSVTTPGEGTFTRSSGTVVNLVAEAEEGYRFDKWTGDVDNIGNVDSATTTITMQADYSITANFEYTPMVAAGYDHTVGLKSDGTVVAVGDNYYGQRNVSGWTDIVEIAAGGYHTIGVKSDGTVVAVGPEGVEQDYGQCNLIGWMLD